MFGNENHDLLKDEWELVRKLDPVMLTGDKLTAAIQAQQDFEQERQRIWDEQTDTIRKEAELTDLRINKAKKDKTHISDALHTSMKTVEEMAKRHSEEHLRNKERYCLAMDAVLEGTPLAGLNMLSFEQRERKVNYMLSFADTLGFAVAHRDPDEVEGGDAGAQFIISKLKDLFGADTVIKQMK